MKQNIKYMYTRISKIGSGLPLTLSCMFLRVKPIWTFYLVVILLTCSTKIGVQQPLMTPQYKNSTKFITTLDKNAVCCCFPMYLLYNFFLVVTRRSTFSVVCSTCLFAFGGPKSQITLIIFTCLKVCGTAHKFILAFPFHRIIPC